MNSLSTCGLWTPVHPPAVMPSTPPDAGGGGGAGTSPATLQAWPLTWMALGAPVPDVICSQQPSVAPHAALAPPARDHRLWKAYCVPQHHSPQHQGHHWEGAKQQGDRGCPRALTFQAPWPVLSLPRSSAHSSFKQHPWLPFLALWSARAAAHARVCPNTPLPSHVSKPEKQRRLRVPPKP